VANQAPPFRHWLETALSIERLKGKINAQQGAHSGDDDRDDLEVPTNHGAMESSIEHSVSVSEADQSTPRCHRLHFEAP
jgi:hypothetical protein